MKLHRLIIFIACMIALQAQAYVQEPRVSTRIRFADMQLQITKEAKEQIQKKVHCLVRSPKDYKIIFDRASLLMPIIERVMREEGLPEDFKYLVIQESRLVADEVSTSNAVGFWQLKSAGASEVGLRMDHYIDERMHIAEATRGFARYVKSHNTYFHNWLYSLLAFHLGRTGVQKFTDKRYFGVKTMKIDQDTHWYIHHFLAHKLVFEDAVGKKPHPELCLCECNDCQGKTLHEISQHFGVSQLMLRAYNKWLKPLRVPEDATCAVIIPMTHQQYASMDVVGVQGILARYKIDYSTYWNKAADFPVVTTSTGKNGAMLTNFNGIAGVIAQPEDNLASLARAGNVSLKQFLAFNDIDQAHCVAAKQVYYFKAKKSKAGVHYHIVRPGETWWSVAQKYGIKKQALLSKNRVRQETAVKPGRVLWLRFIRPANIPIAYEKAPSNSLDQALSEEAAAPEIRSSQHPNQ